MDLLVFIIVGAIAAAPLAVLSSWLIGPGQRPLGALMHGPDAWRRSTMSWPEGVQEEYDVRWRVRETRQRSGEPDPEATSERSAPALPVAPVDAEVHLRGG